MMLIQWCLIFKLIFTEMWNGYGCVPKVGVLKGTTVESMTFEFHGPGLALSWHYHLPAVCLGASYLTCWASPFSFALGHNEWVDILGCLCKIHSLPSSLLTHGLIHSGLGHLCMQSNLDLFSVSEGKYCLG